MSACETKKALKAKIDVANQLLSIDDKDELVKKIEVLKQESSSQLASVGRLGPGKAERIGALASSH